MIDEVQDPKERQFKELQQEFKTIELEEKSRSDQSGLRPLIEAVVNSIEVCNGALSLWVLSRHASLESNCKSDVARLKSLSEEFRSQLLEWDSSRKSLIQTLPKPNHFQGDRNALLVRARLGHIPDAEGNWKTLDQGKQLLQTATKFEGALRQVVKQFGDGDNMDSSSDFDLAFSVTLERVQKQIVAAVVGWENLKRLGSEAKVVDGNERSAWASSLVGLERLLEKAKVAQRANRKLGAKKLAELLEAKPGVDLGWEAIRKHLAKWVAEGQLLPFPK